MTLRIFIYKEKQTKRIDKKRVLDTHRLHASKLIRRQWPNHHNRCQLNSFRFQNILQMSIFKSNNLCLLMCFSFLLLSVRFIYNKLFVMDFAHRLAFEQNARDNCMTG